MNGGTRQGWTRRSEGGAASVDLESGRRVDADYLVLATGSRYAYPARPTVDAVDDALDDALEELRRTHKELAGARREAGRAATFTVTTNRGDEITADIWFQAHTGSAPPATTSPTAG